MAKVNQMINFGQTQMPFPNYEQNPTNFFWRFSQENSNDKAQLSVLSSSESEEEDEEPELNLCLSLGGIYAKPTKEKQNPLARSSSIAGEESETHRRELETLPFLPLSRSCSLPMETNSDNSCKEEMVKLRDLASMRRMAAKKRLAEKQRGFRDALEEEVSPAPAVNSPTSEIAAWAAASAAKSAALSRAICKIKGQERLTGARDNKTSSKNAVEPSAMFSAMVSNGGQFVMPAELENNKPQQNPPKKVKAFSGKVLNNWADVMNRMPSVTTTGDGPNGKRIDGFLYKYTKGQVSIVCVCHGSFLSPAEFIKHAGGKEVANPMRHINVCTALPL